MTAAEGIPEGFHSTKPGRVAPKARKRLNPGRPHGLFSSVRHKDFYLPERRGWGGAGGAEAKSLRPPASCSEGKGAVEPRQATSYYSRPSAQGFLSARTPEYRMVSDTVLRRRFVLNRCPPFSSRLARQGESCRCSDARW
jgi:hypothetical protein